MASSVTSLSLSRPCLQVQSQSEALGLKTSADEFGGIQLSPRHGPQKNVLVWEGPPKARRPTKVMCGFLDSRLIQFSARMRVKQEGV